MILARNCFVCRGMCCKCITLRDDQQPESFFERISGFDALRENPFLPISSLFALTSHNLRFYKCKYVTDEGLCSIYDDRPSRCREFPSHNDDDLLNFVFPVPWCYFRYKQMVLLDKDFTLTDKFHECIASAITHEEYEVDVEFARAALDGLPLQQDRVPQRTCSSFLYILKEAYRVQVLSMFDKLDARVPKMDFTFNKIALKCYEYGINPQLVWIYASEFWSTYKGKLPFPTMVCSEDFWKAIGRMNEG